MSSESILTQAPPGLHEAAHESAWFNDSVTVNQAAAWEGGGGGGGGGGTVNSLGTMS